MVSASCPSTARADTIPRNPNLKLGHKQIIYMTLTIDSEGLILPCLTNSRDPAHQVSRKLQDGRRRSRDGAAPLRFVIRLSFVPTRDQVNWKRLQLLTLGPCIAPKKKNNNKKKKSANKNKDPSHISTNDNKPKDDDDEEEPVTPITPSHQVGYPAPCEDFWSA